MNSERGGTWLAVQRALRTGHAPDARIDALAREQADRTMRNSWMVGFYAVVLAIQVVLLAIRIAAGDDLLLPVVILVLWAAGLAWLVVYRNRSRRYLGRE